MLHAVHALTLHRTIVTVPLPLYLYTYNSLLVFDKLAECTLTLTFLLVRHVELSSEITMPTSIEFALARCCNVVTESARNPFTLIIARPTYSRGYVRFNSI